MWQCKKCGESVDDDFEVCWNCCASETGKIDFNVPDESEEYLEQNNDRAEKSAGVGSRATVAKGNRLLACLRWFRGWLCGRSCVVIGLILQVTLISLYLLLESLWRNESLPAFAWTAYMIALFIPGAVKRWKVTHVFVMGILGAVAVPLTAWLLAISKVSAHPPWNEFAGPALMMILVGVGEWLLRPGDSMRGLAWTVPFCLAAAGGYAAITFFATRMSLLVSVTPFALTPLLVVATWLAIATAERIAAAGWRMRAVGLASATVLLGGFFFTYHIGIYQAAKMSLTGTGPFSRDYAVLLLAHRGLDSDHDVIIEQLRDADWTEPFSYPPGTINTAGDWRETAVARLIRNDAALAAERLAALLIERPSRQLIDMSNGLFAEQQRYETAPILLRYALVESTEVSVFARVGDNRYKEALEELETPQVVWAWLVDSVYSSVRQAALVARAESRPLSISDADLLVTEPLRKRLAKLLGEDAGPLVVDWGELYDERIQEAPTPLSKTLQEETNRVVEAFRKYRDAANRWYEVVDGSKTQEPKTPNWDVRGIDDLEKEVEDYVGRVELATGKLNDKQETTSDPK